MQILSLHSRCTISESLWMGPHFTVLPPHLWLCSFKLENHFLTCSSCLCLKQFSPNHQKDSSMKRPAGPDLRSMEWIPSGAASSLHYSMGQGSRTQMPFSEHIEKPCRGLEKCILSTHSSLFFYCYKHSECRRGKILLSRKFSVSNSDFFFHISLYIFLAAFIPISVSTPELTKNNRVLGKEDVFFSILSC